MQLIAYCVSMYRSILDSGWIEVVPLTTMVGKNESGKTSLLRALHKLNPFRPDPYVITREWPRGHRKSQDPRHIVCQAKFLLSEPEIDHLTEIASKQFPTKEIIVARQYDGTINVLFPDPFFEAKLRPAQLEGVAESWPDFQPQPLGEPFKARVRELQEEIKSVVREGTFSKLADLPNQHRQQLMHVVSGQHPQNTHEQNYINQHVQAVSQVGQQIAAIPSDLRRAHEYVVNHMPTFIYMDDYRAFSGTARLDQVKQRVDQKQTTPEDKTLLTIMDLAGLDLDEEVRKGNSSDADVKEQRQFDLSDASATLTREIEGRWRQKKYTVNFNADQHQFFTFVKDAHDTALIRLEERSKGFQWFFSFDLLFMAESQGEFTNCVLLLDEPGLHLHADAQKDLLTRLEAYAETNTLIYTTHLPFMIDLRHPARIRVVSETEKGTVVTEDLNDSQPEARLTLQSALGMGGSASFLLADRNLVVEGVDDYWVITELSNLLIRSGDVGLPEDVFVTAARGASEAVYITTFMIGQKLGVVTLFDTDQAGETATDQLVKSWLTLYNDSRAKVLSLGPACGSASKQFLIEDLFPDDFYLRHVREAYQKELTLFGITDLQLRGSDPLPKRVERAAQETGFYFTKGRVSKLLRRSLSRMKQASELPAGTLEKAQKLITAIRDSLPSQ
jgi:predicted ATP-dependent endonuclease of OLD family